MKTKLPNSAFRLSRRGLLQTAAGLAGGAMLPGVPTMAFADDKPAIGTYPAGVVRLVGVHRHHRAAHRHLRGAGRGRAQGLCSSRSSTSTADNELIKKISPKTTKGVLGKELKFGVANSAAKPNEAVQAQQRFITENKAMLITGRTSSAVAVALNKLAQREKVLYVAGISGSNDTTGKDCVRYGFRQNFYGQTAAAAIGPVIVKAFGKNKKAAYLTPDYTYGHTVTKSMQDYLATAGWTTATNQVAPLGAPDYSSYLLNVANSGADVLINVNWGHDAVLSTQQAKQFGVLDKMKLVVPYQVPFIARETGGLMQGVYAATDYWWTIEDKYPLAKMFNDAFEQEVRLQAGVGRRQRLYQLRALGPHGRGSRQLLSARRHQDLREGRNHSLVCRRRALPPGGPPVRPSCHHRQGQDGKGHEEQGGLLRRRRDRPRRRPDAEARRVRLQPRRIHLSMR